MHAYLASLTEESGGLGQILVVSSDAAFSSAMRAELERLGHAVRIGTGAVEAAQLLAETRCEVVLCDQLCEGLDSLAFCREVKLDTAFESIFCVMILEDDDVQKKVDALEAGADDYVVRGCRSEEIFARVRSGVRLNRMQLRLAAATETDDLTGLRNRRYFDQRIQEEVARARRYFTPMSLLLVDIDEFDLVNDHYGRPLGDRVLQQIATVVADRVRKCEVLCRYGGDEFAVLLTNTGSDGAAVLGRQLKEHVARERVRLGGGLEIKVEVTVACVELGAGMTSETLIEAADAELARKAADRREQAREALEAVAQDMTALESA
ncbi:MAG: diguanylate cyclase [Planctomycetota bacterium]